MNTYDDLKMTFFWNMIYTNYSLWPLRYLQPIQHYQCFTTVRRNFLLKGYVRVHARWNFQIGTTWLRIHGSGNDMRGGFTNVKALNIYILVYYMSITTSRWVTKSWSINNEWCCQFLIKLKMPNFYNEPSLLFYEQKSGREYNMMVTVPWSRRFRQKKIFRNKKIPVVNQRPFHSLEVHFMQNITFYSKFQFPNFDIFRTWCNWADSNTQCECTEKTKLVAQFNANLIAKLINSKAYIAPRDNLTRFFINE